MITLPFALAIHPRLASRAVPLAPIAVSPAGVTELGLRESQLTPVGADVLSAQIDVPPGEWLMWPTDRCALWIGRRIDALPAVVRARLESRDRVDLAAALSVLADVGVWLREAAVLIDGTWSPSRRSGDLLDAIEGSEATALSGIFVDQSGRSTRLEITGGGVWWTEHPTLAVEWLLAAHRLAAPQ